MDGRPGLLCCVRGLCPLLAVPGMGLEVGEMVRVGEPEGPVS